MMSSSFSGLVAALACSLMCMLVLGMFGTASAQSSLNNRPVVGILTQPAPDYLLPWGKSYLAASYVKWVESAGARVAIVPWNADEAELEILFQSLNGILLTGGGLELWFNVTYTQTAEYLYNLAIQANDNDDYFPIWGTCQGFQILCVITSRNESLLEYDIFNSENLSVALDFTPYGKSESRLFAAASPEIMRTFAKENVTMNLHVSGINPEDFNEGPVGKFYNLISTNVDRNGRPFASTMEAKDYPIYAAQWHAERNQFEWDSEENLDHSPEAIIAMEYIADFFGNEVRQNFHSFPSDSAYMKYSIYNWNPIYTGNFSEVESFPEQQVYVFPF